MTIDNPQRQLQQACIALDRALRAGESARVEAWLDACPAVASDADLALELIYAEFVTREALGVTPNPAEYYRRFPDRADRLRRLFEVDDLLKPEATMAPDDTAPNANTPATASPRRVGPFEIVERLGGGGMGVVYRARQSKPSRDVALKLLKAGAEAGALELARFRRESEAIAKLQHANIVTVYEVGSDAGQPYLAMEYIPGGDLHQHLNGRPQSPAWSATLIATLARAVHYAHEQGVVHRDIKPANILLSAIRSSEFGLWNDETPEIPNSEIRIPKLTDFGLAALAGEAGLTRTGQVLGTLAYLAPEQASATDAAAMPGVDIYALGAVLYECLTGRPPVLAESEAEALRQIQNDEPMSPRKLRSNLSRDLETIVLKCLQKEPAKRYASALALAEDLDRFLKQEPIRARPVSPVESAWKWSKRKPSLAALAAVSLAAIAAIVAIVIGYTSRLESSLAEEDRQRQLAVTRAAETETALAAETRRRAQARAALDQLTARLFDDSTQSTRRSSEQIASIEAAIKSYEELAADTGTDAASREGAALAAWNAGYLANGLGRYQDAEQFLNRSMAIWQKLRDDHPDTHTYTRGYAVALQDRAKMYASAQRYRDAAADFHKSSHLQQLYRADNAVAQNLQLGTTVFNLMLCFQHLNEPDKALETETKGIDLCEKFLAADPQRESYRHAVARFLQNRGHRLLEAGDLPAARADLERTLELHMTNGKLSKWHFTQSEHADTLNLMVKLEVLDKHPERAPALVKEALALRENLCAAHPAVVAYHKALASMLGLMRNNVGRYIASAELDAAYTRNRPVIEARALLESESDLPALAGGLACDHGSLLVTMKRADEARACYAAAKKLLDAAARSAQDSSTVRRYRVNLFIGESRACQMLKKFGDSAAAMRSAIALEPVATRRAGLQAECAMMLAKAGDHRGAADMLAVIDGPPQSYAVFRATAYAIIANATIDEFLASSSAAFALEWLDIARSTGELALAHHQTLIARGGEWQAFRDEYGLERLRDGLRK